MAGQAKGTWRDRGMLQLNSTLIVVAALTLAVLICLALVSWFARAS